MLPIEQLPIPLLEWYRVCKRDLPWRRMRNPYTALVAELMLQQTRVEAVKERYVQFLEVFPTPEVLAEASEEEVLKLWEGLGYYSRARNLHKAAKVIAEHGFPQTFEGVRALPGVGDYTAGAVCSIALGLPAPAVDGNVLRVIMRLTGCREDVSRPAVKLAVADALRLIYPAGHCGDFTQALMELGALVCLPNGEPLCDNCPWRELCRARREESTGEIPVKSPKKPRREDALTVFLLRCGDFAAFHRRPKSGLLAGMWELPNVAGTLSESAVSALAEEWNLAPKSIAPAGEGRHIFTHRQWNMTAFRVECAAMPDVFFWVKRAGFEAELALPSAFRSFLAALWR